MHNSLSPYIQLLSGTEIQWEKYSISTLNKAIKENKMIFIHIGELLCTEERINSLELFRNETIVRFLNNNFISILIDSEDIPEATIVGLDLILINEKKISSFLNILTLPNGQPFTSFSTLHQDECIYLLQNALYAFNNKRKVLMKAAEYMTVRLKNSGVVLHKKPIVDIKAKVLHAYVRQWKLHILKNYKSVDKEYVIKPRLIIFLLKYAIRYSDYELLEDIKQRALEVVFSPIFDPIDGGIFLRATDYSLTCPKFEKNISENAQSACLFMFLYRQFKLPIFKYASERIINFVEDKLKSDNRGYYLGITLKNFSTTSRYYQFSLKQIKDLFPDKWEKVASSIGMNITHSEYKLQFLHFTDDTFTLSADEIALLKGVRNANSNELIYDKRIITAYNSLYAITLFITSKINIDNRPIYINRAKDIIENILSTRTKDSPTLCRYVTKQVKNEEFFYADLHDYSLLTNSLLLCYIVTKEKRYFTLAKEYIEYTFLNYYQSTNGMFNETSSNELFTAYKRESIIDYTRYSGNSIMARNLLVFYRLTNDKVCLTIFKQLLSNIEDELIGSGPYMAGWALQILNYLTDIPGKEANCLHS